MVQERQTQGNSCDLDKVTDFIFGKTAKNKYSSFLSLKDMRKVAASGKLQSSRREGKDYNSFGSLTNIDI